MNKTIPDALGFIDEFLPSIQGIRDRDIVIAPPFTALEKVSERLKGTAVMLSAQDVFYEEKGAYTGEVSAIMLKDAGSRFVIIGHSERRQYFGDTDEKVNKKIKSALKEGLGIIFCIGETLDERKSGRTFDVLRSQIRGGLKDIIGIKDIVIAYEPVWAIGTGVTATTEQAEEAHKYIRSEIRELYAKEADDLRILYGGSVTPENIQALMFCADVDGALVGGASLKAESFGKIVNYKKED